MVVPTPVRCPLRQELVQLSSGELADDDADRVAAHLTECPQCQETVAEIDATKFLVESFGCEPLSELAVEQEPDYRRLEPRLLELGAVRIAGGRARTRKAERDASERGAGERDAGESEAGQTRPPTLAEFLERLELSGLLVPAYLESLRQQDPVDDGPVDDGRVDDGPADDGPVDDGPADDGRVGAKAASDAVALADRLVRQGTLTAYQARRLLQGACDGLVLGKYVILDELGQGGMGQVFRAEHRRLKRIVALKLVAPTRLNSSETLLRFHREVQAAARLRHPNIVATDDADEARGTHFLVMEYVDGRDLAAVVRSQGPLAVEHALRCVIQAAQGLDHAHRQGVLHRDVKPSNLLLARNGTVKVLDLGLARLQDAAGDLEPLTQADALLGTADYMAPEQAESLPLADARSDVYSLGATLWYLLTGKPMYGGQTIVSKLLAHRDAPLPSLREQREDVPAKLEQVFLAMVAKSPGDRLASMADVVAELQACLSLCGAAASGGSVASDDLSSAARPPRSVAAAADPRDLNRDSQPPRSDCGPQRFADSRRPARFLRVPPLVKRSLAGLAVLGGLLLAAVFLLQTPHGTLRIEVADPEIQVTVKGTQVRLKGVHGKTVRVTPGEQVLRVSHGDLEFETDSLVIRKRQQVLVRVERLAGQVRAVHDDRVIGSVAMPPAVPAERTVPAEPAVSEPPAVPGGTPLANAPSKPAEPPQRSITQRPLAERALTERAVSEWALDLGAVVITDLGTFRPGDPLPPGSWTVTELEFTDVALSDEDLARLQSLRQVQRLEFERVAISETGFRHLAGIPSLRSIFYMWSPITDAGLAELKALPRLEYLAIPQEWATPQPRGFTEQGLRELAEYPCLTQLGLFGVDITDEDLKLVGRISRLTRVFLQRTRITDAGLMHLAPLKQLEVVWISDTAVTDAGIEAFRKVRPGCRVLR